MASVLDADTRVVVVPIVVPEYDPPTGEDSSGASQFGALPRTQDDLALLRRLFESPRYRDAGFRMLGPIGGSADTIIRELTRIKKSIARRPPEAAIMYWTGHGRTVQNELRLVTQECCDPISASDGLAPGEVVGKLADAGVGTLVVLLDVCQAAAAGAELITAAAKRSFERSPDNPFGLSALFSAYPFESAEDGFFVESLTRLLWEGPSQDALTKMAEDKWEAFNPNNRMLSLGDIADALDVEINVAKSRKASLPSTDAVQSGRSRRLFPNPRYSRRVSAVNVDVARRRRLLHQDVETHFLPKARGLEPGEEGWFFSGRRALAGTLVQWLQRTGLAAAQNLFVLTGEGGTGKSAVIGRLVTLCDGGYRATAQSLGWRETDDEADGTVPPIGAVDAALHLRKHTAQEVCEILAELLELPIGDQPLTVSSFAAIAADARNSGRTTTVVLDALDESNEPARIAGELIRPLARKGWRLLVATRQSAADRGIDDLLAVLGPAHVHDLDQERDTQNDIREYVERRLMRTPESPYARLPERAPLIAAAIAHRAGGKFLYARFTAGGLLRHPGAVEVAQLDDFLAANLGAALTRELHGLDAAFQQHFARGDDAATALLAALAWSEGDGLPLRDELWPAIATAVGMLTVQLQHEHAQWVLREAGRFIVEDGDGEQVVYRLYHQSLNDHFRARAAPRSVALRIADQLDAQVLRAGGWRRTNSYIVIHMATHLARSHDEGRLLRLLLEFSWLAAKLAFAGIEPLLADYALYPEREGALRTLRRALAQSAPILARDPRQLVSQLLARLTADGEPELAPLLTEARAHAPLPWLRPLTASLADERSTRWLRPVPAESMTTITLTGNGRWAAHASFRENVMLWDLARWSAQRVLFQASSHPHALALSDDARWCLFADSIGGVYRWSAASGEFCGGHEHGESRIANLLALSDDGRFGVSATSYPQRGLIAWDFERDRREVVRDDERMGHTALSLARSGQSTAVGLDDGSVLLFDLWPARPLARFKIRGRPLAFARFADDSALVTVDSEADIDVRRLEAPERPLATFSTDEQPVAVAVSADDRYIAVGTAAGTVEVWDAAARVRAVRYARAHTYEVLKVAFAPDGRHVLSADILQIKEWEITPRGPRRQRADGALHRPMDALAAQTSGKVKVTAEGTIAIAMLTTGSLGVWDLRSGIQLPALASGCSNSGESKGIALAADAPRVLAWNASHLVVWDLAAKISLGSVPVSEVRAAAMVPDGSRVLYAEGSSIFSWWLADRDPCLVGKCDSTITALAISPDGRQALSCGYEGHVTLWELNPSRAVGGRLRHRECRIHARNKPAKLAFAGSRTAVVATGGGELFALDTRDARHIHYESLAPGHTGVVIGISTTRDGAHAVTSSHDTTVMVWNLAERRRVAVFPDHHEHVQQLSADFSRMLTTSFDGVVRVLSRTEGTVLAEFQGDKQLVSSAADPALRWIAATDQGGQIHFLHLEEGDGDSSPPVDD